MILFILFFQSALSWFQGLLSKFQIVQRPDSVRPVAKSLLQPRRLLHRSQSLPLLNESSVTIYQPCLSISVGVHVFCNCNSRCLFLCLLLCLFLPLVCYRDIKTVFLVLFLSWSPSPSSEWNSANFVLSGLSGHVTSFLFKIQMRQSQLNISKAPM